MDIQYRPTPNPGAGKFTVGRIVVEGGGSRSFNTAEQAAADPIAAALFALDGVASIFMADDFVTVIKDPAADWSDLVPLVTSTLEEVLA